MPFSLGMYLVLTKTLIGAIYLGVVFGLAGCQDEASSEPTHEERVGMFQSYETDIQEKMDNGLWRQAREALRYPPATILPLSEDLEALQRWFEAARDSARLGAWEELEGLAREIQMPSIDYRVENVTVWTTSPESPWLFWNLGLSFLKDPDQDIVEFHIFTRTPSLIGWDQVTVNADGNITRFDGREGLLSRKLLDWRGPWGSSLWFERLGTPFRDEHRQFLTEVSSSDTVLVRFFGGLRQRDFTMTSAQRELMRRGLDFLSHHQQYHDRFGGF